MEHGKEHELENALRESRLEPDDRFVGALSREIGSATRSRRLRRRWFGVGAALTLTAVMIAALGASMGAKPLSYAPSAVVGVVSDAVTGGSADQSTANTPADDQYKPKCNSGRGNLSETDSGTGQTDSSTLINPHDGGTGPGDQPTDDCDPGNSGPHNSGGD